MYKEMDRLNPCYVGVVNYLVRKADSFLSSSDLEVTGTALHAEKNFVMVKSVDDYTRVVPGKGGPYRVQQISSYSYDFLFNGNYVSVSRSGLQASSSSGDLSIKDILETVKQGVKKYTLEHSLDNC